MHELTAAHPIGRAHVVLGAVFGLVAIVLSYERLGSWPLWWAAVLTLIGTVAAIAVTDVWVAAGESLTAAQIVLVLLAIWACVPETDHLPLVVALFVAVASVRLVGWSPPRVRLLYPAMVSVIASAGLMGSAGRPSAYVGFLITLGSLLVVPAAIRLRPGLGHRTTWIVVIVVGAADLVLARTIGIAGT